MRDWRMPVNNDWAQSAIHALIFAAFCGIIMIVGSVYVASLNNTSPTITDTYGNTLTPVSNQSQNLAQVTAVEGDPSLVFLILIIGAIGLCVSLLLALALMKSALT